MKVKLLKKIRKRFKYKYLGKDQFGYANDRREYWEVLDSQGTEIQKMEHISHFNIGNLVTIDCPTIAEQLAMDIMGLIYVYEHRQHHFKRKNRSFRKKHFNE